MTSTFSSKKASKISKRKLGMESLENREMLSVNPLGVDAQDAPDFVQTAAAASQDFNTEAVNGTTDITYTNGSSLSVGAASTNADASYTLFYKVDSAAYSTVPNGTSESWVDAGWTKSSVTGTANSNTIGGATISPAGFTAGKVVTFTWVLTANANASDSDAVADYTALANESFVAAPAGSTDLSNATVSVSGVTTSAATLTWTKPTTFGTGNDKVGKVVKYYVTIGTGTTAIDVGTKTTYTVTGLTANTPYTITADILDATTAKGPHTVDIGTGNITLGTLGTAAAVTVGAPTDVKAAYVKASGTKPAGVKVTWKAPANYTGGYTVTLTPTTGTATVINVLPGAKLEALAPLGNAASGTELGNNLRYSVVVEPVATNKIASTPTYVNVGTVAAATVVPGAPASVTGGSPITNLPGGGKFTLAVNGTDNGETVGYYVSSGATAPTGALAPANIIKYIYVPKGTTSTTVDLKVATGDSVWAYAVSADGSTSATAATFSVTSATDFTADVPATNATNVYPTANDAKTVTVTPDTTTKNKVTVTWTAATDFTKQASATAVAADDFKYTVTGYRVTATLQGGASLVQVVLKANQGNGATFEGLQYGAKYDFKVETLVDYVLVTGTNTDFTTDTASKAVSAGASKAGVQIAKAPTVADVTSVTEKASSNTGIADTVTIAGMVVGKDYIVTVTDNNKAVLKTASITAITASQDFVLDNTNIGTNLTPGAKYTVTVQALGEVPGTVSKGKSVTVTATPFVTGTVKDAKATTINSVKLTVEAPKKGGAAGDKYYVEYTNVVDAKGKPDWNAAAVYSTASTATGAASATDPLAVSGDITIAHLAPGSQYYFRVVTVDKEWTTTGTAVAWSDMTKSVASKEIKVKTVAVPLATISKPGYSVTSGGEFGLQIAGNTMKRVDGLATKQILTPLGTATYTYSLLVSTDSKVDKATGKLNGAKTAAIASLTDDPAKTSVTDKKVTDLSGEVGFTAIFTALSITSGNFSGVKGLNVQVQVDVSYGSSDTFTSYSKVSKVALPKWFV